MNSANPVDAPNREVVIAMNTSKLRKWSPACVLLVDVAGAQAL